MAETTPTAGDGGTSGGKDAPPVRVRVGDYEFRYTAGVMNGRAMIGLSIDKATATFAAGRKR